MSGESGEEDTDGERTPKQEHWIEAMQQSDGRVCLQFPAGPLLCPHYGLWPRDADWPKVYIPRGDGVIKTGETALEIVEGGIESDHARLVPREDTLFGDEESDRPYEVVIRAEDGYDEEHAELLRDRLLADGFHNHAVSVRQVGDRQESDANG